MYIRITSLLEETWAIEPQEISNLYDVILLAYMILTVSGSIFAAPVCEKPAMILKDAAERLGMRVQSHLRRVKDLVDNR